MPEDAPTAAAAAPAPASLRHGARPRAAPNPPASSAMQEAIDDRLPQRRRRHRGPARHRDRAGEQRVGQRDRQRRQADVPQAWSRAPRASSSARPARSARRAAARGRAAAARSGPTPRTVTSTWCATSHSSPAERSTPASPPPRPTCGAVIQPIEGQRDEHREPAAGRRERGDAARHEHRRLGWGRMRRMPIVATDRANGTPPRRWRATEPRSPSTAADRGNTATPTIAGL